MTGLWVVLAVVALVAAFGAYRRLTDGRARAVADSDVGAPSHFGPDLGERATFVQFSSEFCAPCRSVRRVLGDVAGAETGVAHLEIDVAERLDLADHYGVTRTPTVLVVDGSGQVLSRLVGPLRPAQAREALAAVGQPG